MVGMDALTQMNRRVEQGETTRQELIGAAKRLFAELGYEGTSIEAVLEAAKVSRGALYHHFPSKEALFEAVLDGLHADLAQAIVEETPEDADPVEAVRLGCIAWLRFARDPAVQQIVVIDGPSVVGWKRWREIDECHSLGLLKEALTEVAELGRLQRDRVDAVAHVMFAAVSEVALLVMRAEDSEAAIAMGEATIERLLAGLLDG